MYNEERKQEFLRYIKEDLKLTTQSFKSVFKKTEQYEELYNKDLCDFVHTEISKLLSVFSVSSVSALRKNISILRKYTDWCCSCNLSIDNINHYDEIDGSIEGLKRYVNKERSICPDREQVLKDISKLRNSSDRFLILALFEGVRTEQVGELLRVKIDKLQGNVLTFENGEKRILSNTLVKLAKESSEAIEYISLTGNATPLDMEGNIVNSRKNTSNNSMQSLNRRMGDRLEILRRETGATYLTSPRLNTAGIVNELKTIINKYNISKDEVFNDKYLEMISPNYSLIHMSKSVLRSKYKIYL